jgi:subtilisin family serine protease
MSGIAPGAWLGNYNVFPDHVNDTRHGARSEDILNAVDAAIADGMDVLNLSLGGGYHGNNDLLAIGLDNAVEAGVVVAVAAGNSGPGQGTLESPGRARKIITVGASTNQHFVGQPFTYPAGGGTTIGAAVGDFDPLPGASFDLFDTHSDGCSSVDPGRLRQTGDHRPRDVHVQPEGRERKAAGASAFSSSTTLLETHRNG